MKIAIVQFFTSNLSYGKYTKAINERYCNKHKYNYYLDTDDVKILYGCENRSYTWYKPRLLLEVMNKFLDTDYFLFLDADAVVSNEETKIEEFIDPKFDIIAAEDHGPSKLNAGVLLVKNTGWCRKFMQDWWTKGEEYPQYKTGLWHDQTCFGLLMDIIPDVKDHINIITNRSLNWREYNQGNFIFHAFAYGSLPDRTIDLVYEKKCKLNEHIKPEDNTPPKTFIVFHCYLVKKWKEIIKDQLDTLTQSGLLKKIDKIYFNIIGNGNDGEFMVFMGDILKDFPREYQFQQNNDQELQAITKVWELGQEYNCNILYMHSKGVSNDYVHVNKTEVDRVKVDSIRDWRKMLEYFCIKKWEQNLELLKTYDMVGASNNNNWWWGNFWWVNSRHLKKIAKPIPSTRWSYEAWVNERGLAKIYEHNHISFTPYYSNYPFELYEDNYYKNYRASKIVIVDAKYGNCGKQLDEGWEAYDHEEFTDVTELIKANVAYNDNKKISIPVINEHLGGDPCHMKRKGLFVRYYFECDPETIYQVHCTEGHKLEFPLWPTS